MALTPKQERFVQEYLVDLNATAAAIRAGYSKKTAEQIAYKLVQKSSVQSALKTAMDERSKRTEITQDYVLEKLKEITDKAASDTQDGELKYSNKIRALELLGKHLGMFDKSAGTASSAQQEDDPITKSLKESAHVLTETD